MSRKPQVLLMTVILLSLISPSFLFSYTTYQSWQYPKVAAKFWHLPRNTVQFRGREGGIGGDTVYVAPEAPLAWDSDTVKFLRRFDVLMGHYTHAITFPNINSAGEDSFITGIDLSHTYFYGWNYDHSSDLAFYNGSKQDYDGDLLPVELFGQA